MGKPGTRHGVSPSPEHIGRVEGTGGIETSQYPEERKATCDSLSSGERNGISLNRRSVKPGGVAVSGLWEGGCEGTRPRAELQSCGLVEVFWNGTPQRVRALYTKGQQPLFRFSRVAPDLGKPV